ncbi:MAG: M1 family aminopeptidase, partial [Bacteroidales bacterium]|nr:M1 family aminopeptidase [Bacteroidales bacterium]
DCREDNANAVYGGGEPLERGKDWTWEKEHIIISPKVLKGGFNEVMVDFIASDQSFNRNDEYLYTLVVPERSRTIYPCFDQPDMKASFSLRLEVPSDWVAVSAAPLIDQVERGDRKFLMFDNTLPVSTYLFSFVAGKWQNSSYSDNGRIYTAYYRETDPDKLAQLPDIFTQVTSSVRWMEEYTGIDLPFPKYDFVIIPGFQYGGMEHIGAIQFNENTMFLGKNPTVDEKYKRIELIAHETSHLWFGDMVTMEWFDDVWTKEVYANYFAAQIAQPLFPEINHSLNWLKSLTAPAISQDRTPGTTSVQQDLPNLGSAGLVYNNIVYDKAPVVMQKLVALMGEGAFHEGMKEYLKTYAYSNATWDQLVEILDRKTPVDIKGFSQVWVHEKGMPDVFFKKEGKTLTVSQRDPLSRGLLWPQSFEIEVLPSLKRIPVTMTQGLEDVTIELPAEDCIILPGVDGMAYGRLFPDDEDLRFIIGNWNKQTDPIARQSLLMTLWENYLAGRIPVQEFMDMVLVALSEEKDELTASTMIGYLGTLLQDSSEQSRISAEKVLLMLSSTHPLASSRLQILRSLISNASSREVVGVLYDMWDKESEKTLSVNDYMTMSYELAVRYPEKAESILQKQRSRIDGSDSKAVFNQDRLLQFDFISRSAMPSGDELDKVFDSLLTPEGRRMEPWAASVLRYLMHPQRGDYGVKYIRPALDALKDVQRTGDIFFPGNWCNALLSNCTSQKALDEVTRFLEDNPDYPQLLKNKILLSVYTLYRVNGLLVGIS